MNSLLSGQPSEMIEHHGARKPRQHVLGSHDLVRAQMDLHMHPEILRALCQRLDHVQRRCRGPGIELREADAAHLAVCQTLQLRVRDRRDDDRDPAGIAELSHRIKRHLVVGGVGRGVDNDRPARADPALEKPVVRHNGVRLHPCVRPGRRKPRRVVDVHVAVAGAGRRRKLRVRRSGRIGDVRKGHLDTGHGLAIRPPFRPSP